MEIKRGIYKYKGSSRIYKVTFTYPKVYVTPDDELGKSLQPLVYTRDQFFKLMKEGHFTYIS